MSNSRIIRTGTATDSRVHEALELNLRDIEVLGKKIIRDAMDRLEASEAERRELEDEIQRRRDGLESEYAARREELEEELRATRSRLEDEIDSAREKGRAEGFEAGRKEGFAEGHRHGFEKGYADGREAGVREGREDEIRRLQVETEPAIELQRRVAEDLSARRDELVHAARSELLQLATRIAEKILGQEIGRFDDVVLHAVRRAMDMVFLRNRVIIQLHPDDVPVVEKYAAETLDLFSSFEAFELQSSREVERGGCRVVSGTGLLDLSVRTQLEVIEQSLIEAARAEIASTASPARDCAPPATGSERIEEVAS